MKIKAVSVKVKEKNNTPVFINTPFITLDSVLKLSGVAQTGGHAKILISEENIFVNEEVCKMRGKKLYPGDTFSFENKTFEIKSEGKGK